MGARFAGVMLFVLIAIPASGGPAAAQPATPAAGHLEAASEARLQFPAGIEIDSTIEWDVAADETWLELVYRVGESETWYLASSPMTTLPGSGRMEVTAWLDLQAQYIPPGVTVAWNWVLRSGQGVLATTNLETTTWHDDRQDWKHIARFQVNLHYTGLNASFADDVMASAQGTIEDLETRYDLALSEPFELWVYPSAAPFREAVTPNSRETMVAATYPDFSLILAVVPNGDDRELARVIPHEVAHLALFQATDNPFTYLPLWFNEGMATHVQTGGTDGYLDMVIAALERDSLYSLTSIDVSFPYTAFEATLAYAASWSAVEYIEETWGDPGIARLIDAYASGVSWEQALQAALGVTYDELDRGWRDWIATQALDEAA
jgi:hypothetical protein